MPRVRRLGATILLTIATSVMWSGPATADHCPPIDNPDPIPGSNTGYCHSPTPQNTPRPTVRPTTRPATPAPSAPPRTAAPAPRRTSTGTSTGTGTGTGIGTTDPDTTPEPTPFDIEVPEGPLETAEIVIEDGGIEDATQFEAGEQAGSASSWIFGFLVGLLLGGILGRMSWGLKRRRRQQIFG